MAPRYLDAHSVDLPASAPRFVELGHCLWCNKELTGRARFYCSLKTFDPVEYEYYSQSPCYISFFNYFYTRPAYQRAVLIRDNFTCQKCGFHRMIKKKPWLPDLSKLHVDHIIPLSKGGITEMTNLQVLCAKCNLTKGAKVPGEESPGIPSYKLKRNGYPQGKCPECGYESYFLLEWKAEDGYDPRMRKCQCRACDRIYYLAPIYFQEVLL